MSSFRGTEGPEKEALRHTPQERMESLRNSSEKWGSRLKSHY